MKFFRDSDVRVKVRWFFVPEGTPPVTMPTVFRSAVWDSEKVVEKPLGEVTEGRKWVDGSGPPFSEVSYPLVRDIMARWPDRIYLQIIRVWDPLDPPIGRVGDRIPLVRTPPSTVFESAEWPGALLGEALRFRLYPDAGGIGYQWNLADTGKLIPLLQHFTRRPHGSAEDWRIGAKFNPDLQTCDPSGLCLDCGPIVFANPFAFPGFMMVFPAGLERWELQLGFGDAPPWEPFAPGPVAGGFFVPGFFPPGEFPTAFF